MAKVKICGLTRPEDVHAARDADAIGFVVKSPQSRRDLPVGRAASLAHLASPFTPVVAVTASLLEDDLREILTVLRPHALQVPGAIAPDLLAGLKLDHPGVRFLLACRPEAVPEDLRGVSGIVLDALSVDGYGGTGTRIPWGDAARLAARIPIPVILAGGLTPHNVAEAIALARPHAVDVSSGVETGGLKDSKKIEEFIRNARAGSAGGIPHEARF